jgi:hypothetical protein
MHSPLLLLGRILLQHGKQVLSMSWSISHVLNTVTLDGTYAIPILAIIMSSIEEKDAINPEASAVNSQALARRLPCRGCTTRCGLFETCNGRLWRMDSQAAQRVQVSPAEHPEDEPPVRCS